MRRRWPRSTWAPRGSPTPSRPASPRPAPRSSPGSPTRRRPRRGRRRSAMADDLEKLAGKTGSGAITDVSTEGVAWPDGGKPFFESAAYASGREGASVKLVQAVWMDQPSAPDDVVLRSLATKALQLPVDD